MHVVATLSPKEREILRLHFGLGGGREYTLEEIGKRFFQSADLKEIYYKAGFKKPQKIGESKVMRITEKDHRGRYGLTSKEIKKIQERIGNSPSHARITKEGYMLTFEFPIFISKLTKIK